MSCQSRAIFVSVLLFAVELEDFSGMDGGDKSIFLRTKNVQHFTEEFTFMESQ